MKLYPQHTVDWFWGWEFDVAQRVCSKYPALSSRRRWLESGSGLSKWAIEWMSEQESERKREDRRGNRSNTGNKSSDAHWRCRDSPNPWPEHTHTPWWGVQSLRRRNKTKSLESKVRGQTDDCLFFFVCCLRWQKNNCLDQLQRWLNSWLADL